VRGRTTCTEAAVAVRLASGILSDTRARKLGRSDIAPLELQLTSLLDENSLCRMCMTEQRLDAAN
jgi:hypothetical protein